MRISSRKNIWLLMADVRSPAGVRSGHKIAHREAKAHPKKGRFLETAEIKKGKELLELEEIVRCAYGGYKLKQKRSLRDQELVVWKKPRPVDAKVWQLGRFYNSSTIPVYPEVSYQPFLPPAKKKKSEKKESTGGRQVVFIKETEAGKKSTGLNWFDWRDLSRPFKYFIACCGWIIKFPRWITVELSALLRVKARDLFAFQKPYFFPRALKLSFSFAAMLLAILLFFAALAFINKSFSIKEKVLGTSTSGLESISQAVKNLEDQDFKASSFEFRKAHAEFSRASETLNSIGGSLLDIGRFIPYFSSVSSGRNAVEAAKYLASAGEALSRVAEELSYLENPLDYEEENGISFLEVLKKNEGDLRVAREELGKSLPHLEKINADDFPEDKRVQLSQVKKHVPGIISITDNFLENADIFREILGGYGPRKYLFLFQNNHEIRPTGGFIGSYGLLDIKEGRIRQLFIGGIFNPDGQLVDKIVPPKPVQKISAAWSLHDSNWWPDFPQSAQKAILFFEKTGGPTVDGVITFTPEVLREFLEITGPIEMEDYGVTLDAGNFIEKIQEETELNYDKELNQPKKILADLTPILLDKIFNSQSREDLVRVARVLSEKLSQKHILLYSQNKEVQKIIERQGWSGKIMETSKDYLNVVDTNINGYKTDGVIEEDIQHLAEIQRDGSIVNTITITRAHQGGDALFEWWNKVNADYMRVYVPAGAVLLGAEGQTREFNDPPLDYDTLGFRRDADVQREEESMDINWETGTREYEEFGKKVFANWVYVSPGEKVTVKYRYLLPFSALAGDARPPFLSYSLLVQKQSGKESCHFSSEVKFPEEYKKAVWKSESGKEESEGRIYFESDLQTDEFFAFVLSKE